MQTAVKATTYEEAVGAVKDIGILPLSPLFPDYPSLESLTNKADWYTETDRDPWLWRARFPADGVAAYGKFFKKKSILVASELVPWVKAIIGHDEALQERYDGGMVSATALKLYKLIDDNPGVETRALRKLSGLSDTEQKKAYDQAIVELQAGMDIVISGVKQRLNDNGDKNGWNSTSFETTVHWMADNGIETAPVATDEAKCRLRDRLQQRSAPDAMKAWMKLLGL